MKKSLFATALCLFGLFNGLSGSDLKISNEMLFVEGARDNRAMYAVVNVEWKNAWKNDQNHDVVWLFCKFLLGGDGYRHINLRESGHEIVHVAPAGLQVRMDVPTDGTGLFIVPAAMHRGDVSLKIKIAIDPAPFTNFNTERAAFKVFGLEMVYVPTGAFFAGEADSAAAVRYAAFYQPGENGRYGGPLPVSSENELTVGKDLTYTPRQTIYQGDATGVIPKAFPEGADLCGGNNFASKFTFL